MEYILIAIVVLILIVIIISVSNKLNKAIVKIDEAASGIDVALSKRYDVLIKMMDVVKAYTKHEKDTFFEVINLRKNMSIDEKKIENQKMDDNFSKINVVAENYPELKANTNFSELSEELRNTENKISFSRQFYNDSVTMYNTKLELFPSNIVAGMFNFTPRELFAAESDEARKNVKVSFDK